MYETKVDQKIKRELYIMIFGAVLEQSFQQRTTKPQ